MKSNIYEKIFKVIESCETADQLYHAHIYLSLAARNGYITNQVEELIYFGIFTKKADELDYLND